MKRIATILLVLVCIFSLFGCSSTPTQETKNNTTKPVESTPIVTESPKPTTPVESNLKIGEIATTAVTEFILEKLEFSDSSSENDGNTMITVYFKIKNNGKEELDLYKWSYDIVYKDGFKFSKDGISKHYLSNGNWVSDQNGRCIAPLTSKEYCSFIEVPKEVYENTEDPLLFTIHMYVPTDDKEDFDVIFGNIYLKENIATYKIR